MNDAQGPGKVFRRTTAISMREIRGLKLTQVADGRNKESGLTSARNFAR
jgi:hypothetical protein